MDPHVVLGVEPEASPGEVARAYRRLAKRHHPDRGAGDGERIREINAAYAILRDQVKAAARKPRATEAAPRGRTRGGRERNPGSWLPPALRMALGLELLRALEPREAVLLVTDAATWDSQDVRLVVTDRRILWLRDDAVGDRVRWVRLSDVESVEPRRSRRGRRGALRVRVREGRRLSFAELRADVLQAAVRLVDARLRAA